MLFELQTQSTVDTLWNNKESLGSSILQEKNTDHFWDITFNMVQFGSLVLIHDGNKTVLLNLIAFKQCHLGLKH